MNFYSSRTERLTQASKEVKKAYEKRNNVSFLKRNPHLKIIFLDLIIVLLFGVILVPIFTKITRDIKIDNVKIVTKAFVFEENLLVTFKLENLKPSKKSNLELQNVKIEVYSPDNILLGSKSDTLPGKNQKDKYITFKLDDSQNLERINIILTSDNYNREYSVIIDR